MQNWREKWQIWIYWWPCEGLDQCCHVNMDWRFCGDKARSKKSRHTRDGEILRLLHNWTSRKDCTLIVCSEGRAMKVGPRALRKTFSRPQTAKIQSWPCKNIDRGISLRGFHLICFRAQNRTSKIAKPHCWDNVPRRPNNGKQSWSPWCGSKCRQRY